MSLFEKILLVSEEAGIISLDGKVTTAKMSYSYLGLPKLLSILKPLYAKHRIYVACIPYGTGLYYIVKDLDSKESLEGEITPLVKIDTLQHQGGIYTYLTRQFLLKLFNIETEEDDDGQGVTNGSKPKESLSPSHPKYKELLADVVSGKTTIEALETEYIVLPVFRGMVAKQQ